MSALPTKEQLDFLSWEMGAFFHFGIRTFYHGHTDWDGKPMPQDAFDPKELDCEQWIQTVKQAGMQYAILTAKHHDGFANWPSAYTEYSVKNTPYRNGKGDIVKEFTDACRKYGLKVGLYYSPAQWGGSAVPFENDREYDDYFIAQIGELLQNYGKIDYLWFDGCGSENHKYDRDRIMAAIHAMQPRILCFHMWDTDVRWIGNEDGYAPFFLDHEVSAISTSVRSDGQTTLTHRRFVPAECDFRIRSTWFDDDNADTLKTPEELLGIYELSVGRGANFLLNIGPDQRGLLPEPDRKVLLEFSRLLQEKYAHPFHMGAMQKEGNTFVFACDPQTKSTDLPLCNCVVLQEELSKGQQILSFRLWAYLPGNRKKKICLFVGETVGHKRICTFPTMRSWRYEIEITEVRGEANLQSIAFYHTK